MGETGAIGELPPLVPPTPVLRVFKEDLSKGRRRAHHEMTIEESAKPSTNEWLALATSRRDRLKHTHKQFSQLLIGKYQEANNLCVESLHNNDR